MKLKKTLLAFAAGIILLLNILNLTDITRNSTNGKSNNYSISVCSDDDTCNQTVKSNYCFSSHLRYNPILIFCFFNFAISYAHRQSSLSFSETLPLSPAFHARQYSNVLRQCILSHSISILMPSSAILSDFS